MQEISSEGLEEAKYCTSIGLEYKRGETLHGFHLEIPYALLPEFVRIGDQFTTSRLSWSLNNLGRFYLPKNEKSKQGLETLHQVAKTICGAAFHNFQMLERSGITSESMKDLLLPASQMVDVTWELTNLRLEQVIAYIETNYSSNIDMLEISGKLNDALTDLRGG